MLETLVHIYGPFAAWIGLGLLLPRLLPESTPLWIGRGLFWVGMPVEIFALARHTDLTHFSWITPVAVLCTLSLGLVLAFGVLWLYQTAPTINLSRAVKEGPSLALPYSPATPALTPPQQGSFLLCAMLGNTGFVGLAIAASLMPPEHLGTAALFAVMHNVLGLYGFGVFIAHHYGHSEQPWWTSIVSLFQVPSIWAFGVGLWSQTLTLPNSFNHACDAAIWVVIPCAFVLMGMRLRHVRLQNLKVALWPLVVKMGLMPIAMAIATFWLGISGEDQFTLVLMAGIPTALTTLVFAEEYGLDRDLAASGIALSMVALIPLLPFWLLLLPSNG
jgi:malate permease and related proteins